MLYLLPPACKRTQLVRLTCPPGGQRLGIGIVLPGWSRLGLPPAAGHSGEKYAAEHLGDHALLIPAALRRGSLTCGVHAERGA
jgi:hypothetical protein